MRRTIWALGLAMVVLAGCSTDDQRSQPPPSTAASTTAAPARAGAGTTQLATPSAPASASTEPRTAYGKIRADIARQGMTKDLALEQWATLAGGLPGVTVRSGDPDHVLSLTAPLLSVLGFWDRLTPDQQAALRPWLADRPIAGGATSGGGAGGSTGSTTGANATVSGGSSGTSTTAPTPRGTGAATRDGEVPTARLASVEVPAAPPAPAALSDGDLVKTADAYFDEINQQIAAATGASPIPRVTYIVDDVDTQAVAITDGFTFDQQANAIVPRPGGTCETRLLRQVIDVEVLSDQALHSLLAHEMFHCYQHQVVSTFADAVTWANQTEWANDGEADWVMMTLYPTTSDLPKLEQYWREWSSAPRTTLFARAYDAHGFFGHLSDTIGTPAAWTRLLPAAGAVTSAAVYDVLVNGNETATTADWGASYFRLGAPPWDMAGPGPVQPDKPSPTVKPVGNGGEADLGPVQPLGADVYEIPAAGEGGGTIADIVELSPELGAARARDAGAVDQRLSAGDTLNLCFRTGGCACPPGSEGETVATVDATAPVQVGVAGRQGGNVLAQGLSLDEFCKQPKRPRKTSPPCGTSCGYDSADPHLRTYDGRRYDLQTVGEHWLTRTTDGSFGVQVRQEPVPGSRLASRNTAVATKVGRDRVTVTQDGDRRVLRIDGEERIQTDIPLDGGRVTYEVGTFGYGYAVRRDDGTTVTVLPAGRAGLSVYVDPSADLHGRLQGLLGDLDGNPDDDLVVRDGPDLGRDASAADVHRRFGPSWLVGGDSWFDYAPGKATASYDDPTFPDVLPVDVTPTGLEAARRRCRDAGITDDTGLSACAFDLAVTGDGSLVQAHARDASVVAAAQGGGTSTSTTIQGEVTNKDDQPTTTFDGKAGDVVGIGRNDGCVDSYLPFQLKNPDGTQLAVQTGCNMGRLVLPQDGTYSLVANFFKERTGPYAIELVRVRPDRTADVQPGATLTGTVEQRFAHDVYRLEGRAGQVLLIGGEGCTTGTGMTVGIELSGGRAGGGGPACSIGRYEVPEDGPITLVVNTADNATGAYRIPVRAG